MRLSGILLILLGLVHPARAQSPFSREVNLNEQGTPVKVNDLLQDGSGYLWAATDDGIYRFNGKTCTHLIDSIHQPATALARYGEGIVAGYRNGQLGYVRQDTVKPFYLHGYRSFSAITSLHTTHDRILWATTEADGLFLIIGNSALQMTTEEGLTDNFLYDVQLRKEQAMVCTDRGINRVRLKNGRPLIEVFTTAHGLPDNIVRVLQAIPGTVLSWIGTQEGGLALYDDNHKRIRTLRLRGGWQWGQINDILPVRADEAWVATEGGFLLHVQLYGQDSLRATPYEYAGKKLKKLLLDNAGNIWCATNEGLIMNTAIYAQQLRLPWPYSLESVSAMECDDEANLWYSQGGDLYKLPLNPAITPQKILTIPATITTLHYTHKKLWIGTLGKGLFSYADQRKIVPMQNRHASTNGDILSITGSNDDLWVSSLNGVAEMKLDERADSLVSLRSHGKGTGAGSDYIYQLYTDRQGHIWMATDGGGVRMWDGRQIHSWSAKEGLTTSVFYSITEDAAGNIWAASLEQGLFRFDGKTWQHFDEKSGLQNHNISALCANSAGQVVVVSQEDVDQWYPSARQFRHYNRRLGVDIDSTSSVLNCIARDTAGCIIIPFEHGFVFFPNGNGGAVILPNVHISSLSVFFRPVEKGLTEFSHDENHISFHYEGISLSSPEHLYYRYKLQGYEKEWVYTADENVTFPQLRPGNYHFQVQAALSPTFINAATDSYSFSIASPIWQRWWALLIIAALLTSSIFGYIRVRERNLHRLSKLQRERMLFEYEHLKSQVNPHFLFNSLNTLASLIEEDQDAAVDYTVQLSDFYRSMLSFRDKDLISLGEELDILQHYMHIQQSRFGSALQLEIAIPAALLSTARIVPLALQLLVENAIKHNVVSLSRPLLISISATNQEITVRNPLQPKISLERSSGLGLVNIQNRYNLLTVRKMQAGPVDAAYIVTLPLL